MSGAEAAGRRGDVLRSDLRAGCVLALFSKPSKKEFGMKTKLVLALLSFGMISGERSCVRAKALSRSGSADAPTNTARVFRPDQETNVQRGRNAQAVEILDPCQWGGAQGK